MITKILLFLFYVIVWHLIGMFVSIIIDETEHKAMGWSDMMPDWIPIWLYNTLWPLVLFLSLLRNDD